MTHTGLAIRRTVRKMCDILSCSVIRFGSHRRLTQPPRRCTHVVVGGMARFLGPVTASSPGRLSILNNTASVFLESQSPHRERRGSKRLGDLGPEVRHHISTPFYVQRGGCGGRGSDLYLPKEDTSKNLWAFIPLPEITLESPFL